MGLKERYIARKRELVYDKTICSYNRDLFATFFAYLEKKLRRINQLPTLDDAAYKTLIKYFTLFRNTNYWFNNKPWKDFTEADIRRVYDGLEDRELKSLSGNVLECCSDYYNKVFKSKPFSLAGKADLAKTVIEYYVKEDDEVRFAKEASFLLITSAVSNQIHLLLLWLAWDYGENVCSLLKLRKSDFIRQTSKANGEPEYLLNFRNVILKRSRVSRTEPSLYHQTVQLLDTVLKDLDDDEFVFKFGYAQAVKFLKSAVKRSGATCMPHSDAPTWKDLRSGMACHLLDVGWTKDEINARLGHKPGSRVFDKYINYLAINRVNSKKKLYDTKVEELTQQLEQSKQRELYLDQRTQRQEERLKQHQEKIDTLTGQVGRVLQLFQWFFEHQATKTTPLAP